MLVYVVWCVLCGVCHVSCVVWYVQRCLRCAVRVSLSVTVGVGCSACRACCMLYVELCVGCCVCCLPSVDVCVVYVGLCLCRCLIGVFAVGFVFWDVGCGIYVWFACNI